MICLSVNFKYAHFSLLIAVDLVAGRREHQTLDSVSLETLAIGEIGETILAQVERWVHGDLLRIGRTVPALHFSVADDL